MIFIIAGGVFVIIATLVAVYFKQNEALDPIETNMMALSAPPYDGIKNLRNESYDDNSYFIMDQTQDGLITVINVSSPIELEEEEEKMWYSTEVMENYVGETPDYEEMIRDDMERFLLEKINGDARITKFSPNERITEKLTYPAYDVCYEAGENEDSVMGRGIFFSSDSFVFYYGYSCPADDFESYVSDFDSRLGELELVDLEVDLE